MEGWEKIAECCDGTSMNETDPTEDFGKLNLREMPVTTRRRKKARAQAEAEAAAAAEETAVAPSIELPDEQKITSTNSNLTYYVANLTLEDKERINQSMEKTNVTLRDWTEIPGKKRASGAIVFELT